MDRIRLNASEWMDFRSGEKKCFLLTNGLGGYCSLTVMGNAARNDQALLMGALKAPTVREHLISNVWETLEVDGEETELFSQEFVNRTQNVEGFRFLEGFEMGSLPVWFYRVKGVEIEKTIGMVQGENTVLVRYRVRSGKKGSFSIRPVMRFAAKGEQLQEGQDFAVDRKCIASNGVILSYGTNGELQMEKERIWRDLFFEQDARDGRDGIGSAVVNHRIWFEMTGDGREQVFFVVYSLADDVDKWDEERIALWIEEEEKRQDFVCWIRNPSRASWALCIPYEINGEIKPTYPDFIIVREDERLGYVIDILEPHSADFKDNLGKAKGFAEYARQNPGVGRIQLIRMGKDAAGRNQFRRLDMYKTAIREKVSCAINTDELDHIFDTDGVIE